MKNNYGPFSYVQFAKSLTTTRTDVRAVLVMFSEMHGKLVLVTNTTNNYTLYTYG